MIAALIMQNGRGLTQSGHGHKIFAHASCALRAQLDIQPPSTINILQRRLVTIFAESEFIIVHHRQCTVFADSAG